MLALSLPSSLAVWGFPTLIHASQVGVSGEEGISHPDPCFPGGGGGEEPTCQCRRHGFDPWVGKIPWRRAWQPTPVFLPGEPHGQKSLVGYGPWGRKELNTTERHTTGLESVLRFELLHTPLQLESVL